MHQYKTNIHTKMSKPIPLYLNNGVAFVWNAEDWYDLRSNHRICGTLIGSVASFPRQNDFLGLPVALMSEEAALLAERGICELCELPNITQEIPEKQKYEIEEYKNRSIEEQCDALKKRKVEQMSQKIDIIVAGKKQKLLSKGITNVNLDKETLLKEEINKIPPLLPAHILVHLPTEHILETDKRTLTTEALNPIVTKGLGNLKFIIYKDLWEKGNYITSGSKFGSDFLVYPGDPVKFHAKYMVRCVVDCASFSPASLVAFGRLSVAVNKIAVLGFVNNSGCVEYQTLQWHDSVNI